MVVVAGIGSNDSAAGSDCVVYMVGVVHTEDYIGSNTVWMGAEQANMMLSWVHPKPAPHSSLSMCLPFFPSRVGMFCNISLHVLLTYKIYKRDLSGYLQLFENINTPCRDAL